MQLLLGELTSDEEPLKVCGKMGISVLHIPTQHLAIVRIRAGFSGLVVRDAYYSHTSDK